MWAFASLLAPSALTLVLAEVAAGADAPLATAGDGLTAQLVDDELLDATVCTSRATRSGGAGLLTRCGRMVAAVGAAEVIEALSA